MCATTALNRTISGAESLQMVLKHDLYLEMHQQRHQAPKGDGLWCPTLSRKKKVKVHICKTFTQY